MLTPFYIAEVHSFIPLLPTGRVNVGITIMEKKKNTLHFYGFCFFWVLCELHKPPGLRVGLSAHVEGGKCVCVCV